MQVQLNVNKQMLVQEANAILEEKGVEGSLGAPKEVSNNVGAEFRQHGKDAVANQNGASRVSAIPEGDDRNEGIDDFEMDM